MELQGGDRIEAFIRENRDKFEINDLPDKLEEKFLARLNRQFVVLINIVPYLLKVALATILIFIASILVWNNYIRKDRHEIPLKNKITMTINRIFH